MGKENQDALNEMFLNLYSNMSVVFDVLIKNNLISATDFVARRNKVYEQLKITINDDAEKALHCTD